VKEEMICYCFRYSAKDIVRDYFDHGYSTILEQIKNEKMLGNCQCGIKNPKGK
jgi:hypothetical protein